MSKAGHPFLDSPATPEKEAHFLATPRWCSIITRCEGGGGGRCRWNPGEAELDSPSWLSCPASSPSCPLMACDSIGSLPQVCNYTSRCKVEAGVELGQDIQKKRASVALMEGQRGNQPSFATSQCKIFIGLAIIEP